MSTTAERVLSACSLKEIKPGQYRGPSPLRAGSDGPSFALDIDPDGEHGRWYDHVLKQGGSLYDLAKRLGVDTLQVSTAQTKHDAYANLAEYAEARGVTEAVFAQAGWAQVVHHGRPALRYPTTNGDRLRFLDGQQPKYMPARKGFRGCWYGLERAIVMAQEADRALVLCNGEASTVVGQHFGVPACAVAGTGEKALADDLLSILNASWKGPILIAMDCDKTGRAAAAAIQAQLPGSAIVDMQLSDKGDLADFCRLHGAVAYEALTGMVTQSPHALHTSHAAAERGIERLKLSSVPANKPLVIPFSCLRKFGGLAKVVTPGKIVMVVGHTSGGKTSFLETWVDTLLQRGESGFWYGPEWTEDEMHDRRVQRYGGPTAEQLANYEVWKWEQAHNVPLENRLGANLTPDELTQYMTLSKRIMRWPAKAHYLQSGQSLEATLEQMTGMLQQQRKRGVVLNWAVFDYVQLLSPATRDYDAGNQYEHAIELVKKWCIQNAIVGIIASQVNKVDVESLLTLRDMHYVRGDKANLALLLNIVYQRDETGELLPTNRGVITVAKNSTGRKGHARVYTNLPRLSWLDTTWSTERVAIEDIDDVNDIDLSML